jgi:hypothetical protein
MEILSRKPAMIADPACIKPRHSDLYRKGFQRRDSKTIKRFHSTRISTEVISTRSRRTGVFDMTQIKSPQQRYRRSGAD